MWNRDIETKWIDKEGNPDFVCTCAGSDPVLDNPHLLVYVKREWAKLYQWHLIDKETEF